jgi:hypothetical protein
MTASDPPYDGQVREEDAGSERSSATFATEDVLSRRPARSGGLGFVLRQPPSHDCIRQHGAGPKDGWAKGPADPGAKPQPSEPEPSVYGAVHKFGYTRAHKLHELPGAGGDAVDPGEGADSEAVPFVHLHVHSNFSFLDGGSRIEELVARAAELGQPALALTDHDGLYGAVRFAKACGKRGIKPIFGAEIRVESLLAAAESSPATDTTAATTGISPHDPHHLVLLAETREGYANLCRLLSDAHLADPAREHPPVVTLESLRTYADGVICLTGCRHGEVGYLTDLGRDREARVALLHLRDIFGPDHLFVELQYFGYEPHQEAHAGQHGSPVYEKIRADGGRLRHRLTPAPNTVGGAQTATRTNSAPAGDSPAAPAVIPNAEAKCIELHYNCIATSLAPSSQRTQVMSGSNPPRARSQAPRPDLPEGQPQRLNPSDYDIGFHHDGGPWRASCLTYCLDLAHLADECSLPTILTNNAHYAGANDRALHLICRAAGHDRPLSGYPDLVPGARCLKSKVELEIEAEPLLALVLPANLPRWMRNCCTATDIALMRGGEGLPRRRMNEQHSDAVATVSAFVDACETSELQSASFATSIASRVREVRAVAPRATTGSAAQEGCGTGRSATVGLSPLETPWHIAQRCNVDLELGASHFPKVDVPEGETAYSVLAKRCFRGIARKYKPVPPRAVELLEKELRMIQQMDFAHYFLVVHDIVRWARTKGVACSGRGSAGNSIVCHALDITASEPIHHNLLFERFLNPNRREMPDIDVDFCSSRRDEVIDHIYKTFGSANVAVVANVNTMSPRSAVRIVAEALGFAPTEINALAKHVPRHGDAARMREYLGGAWPELRDSPLQDEARWGRFLDLVERLDSFLRDSPRGVRRRR